MLCVGKDYIVDGVFSCLHWTVHADKLRPFCEDRVSSWSIMPMTCKKNEHVALSGEAQWLNTAVKIHTLSQLHGGKTLSVQCCNCLLGIIFVWSCCVRSFFLVNCCWLKLRPHTTWKDYWCWFCSWSWGLIFFQKAVRSILNIAVVFTCDRWECKKKKP